MSYFKKDFKSEQLLARWLDEYFYKRLSDERYEIPMRFKVTRPIEYGKERAREMQQQGIDAFYRVKNGESFLVDEKAQLNYLNNPLETFAFEVLYKRKNGEGSFTHGWFINEDLETTHYLLVYPHSDQVDKHYYIKSFEQFSKAELILIEKTKLKEKLESISISKARVYEKVLEIMDTEKRKSTFEKMDDSEAYIIKTDHLAENPINIVVRKHILNEIAEARWLVTRDYLKEI